MTSRARWRGCLLAVIAALGLVGAGCGGSEQDDKSEGAGSTSGAAALLPERIRDEGKLIVATNATYPPIEYFDADNKTIIGFDPDLGKALGEALGVRFEFVHVPDFAAIIPGLVDGRYDIAMAFMSDLKDRYGKLSFVDYFNDVTVAMVSKDNPAGIRGFDDLCGKTVAVQKGSFNEVNAATVQDKRCAEDGKDRIDIVQLPQATDKQVQLQSGRVDASITDLANGQYVAREAGDKFALAGEPFDVKDGTLIGIAVPKADQQLAKALQAALKEVIADGTYAKLLQRYGMSDGSNTTATINGDR